MSATPVPVIGFRRDLLERQEHVLVNDLTDDELARLGGQVDEGERPRSALWMPLVVAGKGRGWISLQNLDREHAFSESDVQLLGTIAGSLSVALENARLVHETRQRVAELAVINSVQESIAGELDPQAIYDLVGEKLREVFDAQVVDIAIHDADAGAHALRLPDRARRPLPEHHLPGDGLPQARDGYARAARRSTRTWMRR